MIKYVAMKENTADDSRRDFLKRAAGLVVVSVAARGVVLGRLSLPGDVPGKLSTLIQIRLSDYPDLAQVGGSIKLIRDEELLLNPDHVELGSASLRAETEAFSCKRGWYPIAVTRVADVGENAFTAVSTYCPHGNDYQVSFDPLEFRFHCCHQGSNFEPDGTWITPPAGDRDAPRTGTVRNGLRKFRASFDGDNTVTIDTQPASADTDSAPPTGMSLAQNLPNPCSRNTMIPFAVKESGQVTIKLFGLAGNRLLTAFDRFVEPGSFSVDVVVSSLPAGEYIYVMSQGGRTLSRRLTVVR